jgi:hypothetical protein
VYYQRKKWYDSKSETRSEGMRLGVVLGRVKYDWVEVEWEDGGTSRGDEACYRKVSEEEVAAIRMIPFHERTFNGHDVRNPIDSDS